MNKKLIKFVEVFLLNVNWTKLVYKYIHYYYYWCLSYLLLKRIHTKLCQFPLATFHAAQTTLIIFPCYCFLSSVPASCCLHMLTVSAWFPSIMPISIPSSGSIFFSIHLAPVHLSQCISCYLFYGVSEFRSAYRVWRNIELVLVISHRHQPIVVSGGHPVKKLDTFFSS